MATTPLTTTEISLLTVLQLITEDRMAAGLDPDGSTTTARALEILGGWRQIIGPVSPETTAAIDTLREVLNRSEPLLARIAKPTITPIS